VTGSDGVVLRAYRDGDAPDVAAAWADPLIQRFLPHLPHPYTVDDALWWIREGGPAIIAEGGTAYAIADPATDRVVGGGGYGPIRRGKSEAGYWVAPWARRRGVATAAARALTGEAFARGAARVVLKTDLANGASQRVAIASGFTREGVERASGERRDGTRYDQIVWARLATDPEGPRPRLLPDLPGRGAGSPGELTDGVVTLRPLGPDDVDATYELRLLPDVIATSVPPRAPTRDRIERLCIHAEASWLAGERAELAIRDAASGAYAGEIGLYYWEPPTQQGMVGYSLAPMWRGRGYATRAVRLIVDWALRDVGMVRVVAGTAPDNLGSQRVLERAGFVREGYQRARLPGPDGTRVDDINYAVVATQPPG